MKERVKQPHNKVIAKKVDKRSIETAVEYLIQECMRLQDFEGAKILSNAKSDFSNSPSNSSLSYEEEQKAIFLLRETLKLTEDERIQLIRYLELLEYKNKTLVQ